jgi:DNA repair protein RadC
VKSNTYVREAMPKLDFGISLKQRFDQCRAENLRDGELLALSLDLSEEKARKILESTSLAGFLDIPPAGMKRLLGKDRMRKFLCSFELAQRALSQGLGARPDISCPAGALPFLMDIRDKPKEYFLCLYLNARNQMIHKEVISIGSLSASIVHPRECFLPAIEHLAASVILAHNHPSTDVSPSKDDLELTRRLVKAGEIIGIEVLDHIIVSRTDFLSLKEKGLM